MHAILRNNGLRGLLCLACVSLLSACWDSNGSTTTNGNNTPVTTSTSLSRMQDLAGALADTDPIAVNDPSGLAQDINSVFGQPDAEPINFTSSSTPAMVVQQAAAQ